MKFARAMIAVAVLLGASVFLAARAKAARKPSATLITEKGKPMSTPKPAASSPVVAPADPRSNAVAALAAKYVIPPNLAAALYDVALSLGADPEHLGDIIKFESGGTWTSNARNPSSGATGLIQFMPSTARRMGTTVEALAAMSPEAQLRGPVREYMRRVRDGEWWDGSSFAPTAGRPYPPGPLNTFQAVAASVFFPALRYVSPSTALPAWAASANAGINTMSDYLAKVRAFRGRR